MAKVKLGKSVSANSSLWRYMSLDKLINLLESEALFFTPLSHYAKSDPFEGYLPKVAFEALKTIFLEPYTKVEIAYKQQERFIDNAKIAGYSNPKSEALLRNLRVKLDSKNELLKNIYKKTAAGITVNCWHCNPTESEAMWKLYSDNGKGIAIKTNIELLQKSIELIPQDLLIQIGAVKYLDFHDKNMSPKDCIIDGHLSPLLKRHSFSHENEVRLFTVPSMTLQSLNDFVPNAELVKVCTKTLIEKVYISPFASEPFISSTKTICNKYGIASSDVCESTLLKGHEELLNILGETS